MLVRPFRYFLYGALSIPKRESKGLSATIFLTADTGTYRLCADKVVCKRVYEVERILLN